MLFRTVYYFVFYHQLKFILDTQIANETSI